MALASEGSVIAGRYQLEDRLDFGGRAQVWSALDQQLGRRVAVKLLATPEGADPTLQQEFQTAAELEAGLKHPSIVEVLDWGQDDEWNYIVMELLEGQTMARLLKAGPLPPDRVIAIGRSVAGALVYAHGRSIAHGSVGPENIVVAPGGKAAELIGFGVQCRPGACEYPALPDADTYATGATLYEALVGVSPTSPRPADLPSTKEWPQRPRKVNSAVSNELDDVVMKAISPDPSQRYKTAAELQAALDALVAPKKPRVWPWAVAAVVAIIVAVLGLWYITSQLRVVVPDVTKMPIAEAESALASAGLVMTVGGQETSDELPAGVVVAADPAPGTSVRRGSQVSVIESTGKPTVAVPAVVGLEFKAASSAIASAGLVVGKVSRRNDDAFPADTVISQEPAAGQQLTASSPVNLLVSAGEAQATVPDVTGLAQSAATSRLENGGFVVDVGSVYSGQPSGVVVSQGPEGGTSVPVGSTVSISVSRGPAPVRVPDVVGTLQADAVSSLQSVKLVPVSVLTTGTAAQVGRVIEQIPGAGASVAPGSQVQIRIGK